MYTIITITFEPNGGKMYDYLLLNQAKNKIDRKKPLISSTGKELYYVGYSREEKIPPHVTASIFLCKDNFIRIGNIPVPSFTPKKKEKKENPAPQKKYASEREFWEAFDKKRHEDPKQKAKDKWLAEQVKKIEEEREARRKYREERGLYPVWL